MRAHGGECLAIRELRMQCYAIVGAAVIAIRMHRHRKRVSL